MDKNNNTTPSSPIKKDTTKTVNQHVKPSSKMRVSKSKVSLWLLFIILFMLTIGGTYGYFKYHNNQITNLSYLIPTVSFHKNNTPAKPNLAKAKTTTPNLTQKTPVTTTESTPNSTTTPTTNHFAADSKAYQEFILQLSTKLEQMNKDLSNSKAQQQAAYTNIVNRFNLIYALENGEVPLSLSQQVANNEGNPKLQKILSQLTKFSTTGIQTKESLTNTFNTKVYQDIYLQSLKATKSPLGLIKYYFAKIILIQNFDNTTIENKQDIRIKLNNIKFSLEHSNFTDAYNSINTLDSALLSTNTKMWQQQLLARITAEQAIQILKTYK